MIINIPPKETKRWTGPYLGNYYGELWKTFNVDLDRSEGKISLSSRFQRITDSSTMIGGTAESGRVQAFTRTDADCTDRYWALASTSLLKTDSATPENQPEPERNWSLDGIASSPTSNRDMTIHGNDSRADSGRNKLFVTTDTDISVMNDSGTPVWTANWWATKQGLTTLKSGLPFHPIEYFPFRKITLVGDGNLVHTISRPSDTQNDTGTYARLVLPSNLIINHIFTTTNRAWMLCSDRFGSNGAIVEWDGFSQTYNEIHNALGRGVATGINYREIPIVVNTKGIILEYSGKGFVPMMRNGQQISFPITEEPETDLIDTSDTSLSLIGRIDPRGMTIGVDGLIYMNVKSPNIFSPRQDGGIWCLNPITGRLYNKHSLVDSTSDFGVSGAIGEFRAGAVYAVPNTTARRNLLAGGIIYTTAASSSLQTGIWLLEAPTATTAQRGYFITQYVPASEVRDLWDSIWLRFRRFISSNTIVVKAKGTRSLVVSNGNPLVKTITWTSTTTFTVTLAAADDALVVGDELWVESGVSAGLLAHITIISGAHAALQTITIDETASAGSGTAGGRFDRWKKLGAITSTSVYEANVNIGIDSSFIQFKVEMRGPARQLEISDMIINSEPSVYIKK